MNLALWFVNSALVCIFCVALVMSWLLMVNIPPHTLNFTVPLATTKQISTTPKIEKIYLNDLFDTYTSTELSAQNSQPSLPTVPPKPSPVQVIAPTEEPSEFLSPLEITVRGTVLSSQPDASAALIEDETGKEKSFHLGEMVKDAQLVKIAHDRIVILRPNGQQDTLFLRALNKNVLAENEHKWLDIVKKIDENNYDVDLYSIRIEIPSIGQLLDIFSITTAFEAEKPIGLRVGELKANSLAEALGFKPGDVIVEIDNIPLGPINNRIEAFTSLTNVTMNKSVSVIFMRDEEKITHTYTFKSLEKKPAKSLERANIFDNTKYKNEPRISRPQKERSESFADATREMRARLLENMRIGRGNARNR